MRRLLTILFYVVFATVAIASLTLLLPASRRLNLARERMATLETELAARNREVAEMRQFLHDLKDNPRAVEKVAREKFGLCREGETIYLYRGPADQTPAPPAATPAAEN